MNLDERLVVELLQPMVATAAADTFTYSRPWLRGLMAHFTEPRFAPALRNLTPPREYALVWRATLSAAGLFAQLGATVPTRGFHLAYSPGFRDGTLGVQRLSPELIVPGEGRNRCLRRSRNKQTARERIARLRAEQARRRRRRIRVAGSAAAAVVIAVVAGITLAVTGSSGAAGGAPPGPNLAPLSTLGALRPAPAPGSTGSEGVPVPAAAPLAGAVATAAGQPVDQISCQTSEQTLFHIHAHLAIFVNGKARQVPAAIGVPGAQAQQTRTARSSPPAPVFTGCTLTPPTASSISSPRSSGPTLSGTSSMSGGSRSDRPGPARPPGG